MLAAAIAALSIAWAAQSIGIAAGQSGSLCERGSFLVVVNDNGVFTQIGFQVGAAYKAEGGFENDTRILAYRIAHRSDDPNGLTLA